VQPEVPPSKVELPASMQEALCTMAELSAAPEALVIPDCSKFFL